MKEKINTEIAVVVSRFNQVITERLWQGARERLLELGIHDKAVTVAWVPGAIEIPLMAQTMAKTLRFSAVICLGAVIRGETDHYDHVCEQVSQGCQQVALQYGVPIIFGVLTTNNEADAMARAGGNRGHKGREAADAALSMIETLQWFQCQTHGLH